jgi:hypothetical protein
MENMLEKFMYGLFINEARIVWDKKKSWVFRKHNFWTSPHIWKLFLIFPETAKNLWPPNNQNQTKLFLFSIHVNSTLDFVYLMEHNSILIN